MELSRSGNLENASIDNDSLDLLITAFTLYEIAKMDKRNADRKNKPTKAQIANARLAEEVVKYLGDEPVLAGDIAGKGIEGIANAQKATAVLKYLVKAEKAEQVDVKVKGKGVKKGYIVR